MTDSRRGRRIVRALAFAALAAAAWLIVALTTLPPRSRSVAAADPSLSSRTIRGAFHVHTTRSDGALDKSAVAGAARRAGLQFVIFSDHGDGMRRADPPEYLAGVLCIDGVEISTNDGHYVAIGASPAPYPLGGDSRAVVEDVARLGGFGVAAHPGSTRPELAWRDWNVPVAALEWLNADSEWRDESRLGLVRAAAAYPVRPAGALAALLDRPSTTLARWDRLARSHRVLGLAGHDAHGGIGGRMEGPSGGRRIHIPSYEASFRTFSNYVELERALSGQAEQDGRALLDALRAGRVYTILDALAPGATLQFTGRSAEGRASMGEVLPGGGTAAFSARAAVPEGATMVAFRDGEEIARAGGGTLEFQSAALGAYRVEGHLGGAPGEPPVPWLVSNPIFRLVLQPPAPHGTVHPVLPLEGPVWRIEMDPSSSGSARRQENGEAVLFEYQLGSGASASPFVALAADLPDSLPPFSAVTFRARSERPMRLSVQLRFARDGHVRWGRSVYVDAESRPIHVRADELRPTDGRAAHPPGVRRATSLLLVVDLTNARPGDSGRVTLHDVALAR